MYPITNEVMALFESEQRKVLRITGTDKNGATITITDNNVIEDSFQIDRYSCNGEKLEIGTAVAAQMTMTLENGDGQYDGIVFEGAELFVEVGIADWTQSSPTVTYIPCGYFTPDEQPRRLSTISITALDRMMRFDAIPLKLEPWTTGNGDVMTTASGEVIYFIRSVRFPATIAQIVAQVAALCGVPFTQDLSGFPNASVSIPELPVATKDITFRNIIQWCAGIMGANAWIDWNGQLWFSWYNNTTGYVSTIENRYSSDLYENDLTITGVVYTNNDGVEMVDGTDDYALDLTGNSFVGPMVTTVLPVINAALNGFTYRPFMAAVVNAPYLWPMDIVTFTDKNGNDHTCALTNVAFGLNGTTALESKGMTYEANKGVQPYGFTKQQAQLVNEVKQSIVNLDDSLTQEEIFNRLTDNGAAQGIVLYNGQLYVNAGYIRTGFLSANRIQGGTLTLGGMNNINGEMQVLDASGNEIGSITDKGIVTSAVYLNDTISVKLDTGALKILYGGIEMGRIWAAMISGSDEIGLFIYGPTITGSNSRSTINMWPSGDVSLNTADSTSALTLYQSGDVRINANGYVGIISGGDASIYLTENGDTEIRSEGGAASIILNADGTIDVVGSVLLSGSIDSSLTINDDVAINGDLIVDANAVSLGDTTAKIVKLADGTVYIQSSGDASVYVTDGGNAEIRSDGGAASIILNANGDINVTGAVHDNRILEASSAISIPSAGNTSTGYITGLTSDHQLVRWNFSSSAENMPPADLEWNTYDGYFTITNNGGTTSESITPVFILPQ